MDKTRETETITPPGLEGRVNIEIFPRGILHVLGNKKSFTPIEYMIRISVTADKFTSTDAKTLRKSLDEVIKAVEEKNKKISDPFARKAKRKGR